MVTELAPPTQQKISAEEYLVRERAAEYRSDYVYGEIRAMSGGSLQHGTIIASVTREIGIQLKGKPCFAVSGDVKILADEDGLYVYPDLTVVCDEPRFVDGKRDVLMNPAIIFEVLSPSTEGYDRGLKSIRYREIESLREYVLISQDEPLVERYTRQPDGLWLLSTINGLGGRVELQSIGCTLLLSELYDRVQFAR